MHTQCVPLNIMLFFYYNEIMLNINQIKHGERLTITLDGKLDTSTAPEFEAELKSCLEGIKTLVLDFSKLEYISSAGLRTVLMAKKAMDKQGRLVLSNVNQNIMEILELTGFQDILELQ